MKKISTVYLRFGGSIRPREDVIISGLAQAKDLGAEYLRIFGPCLADRTIYRRVLAVAAEQKWSISLDLDPTDLDDDILTYTLQHVSSLDLGLSIPHPYWVPPRGIIGKSLLANIIVSNETADLVNEFVPVYLNTYGFGRLKLIVHVSQLGSAQQYLDTATCIKQLHPIYGDKLYASLPYYLLTPETVRLARQVCNYREIIGMFSDGVVCACGVDRNRIKSDLSLQYYSLKDLLGVEETIRQLHAMTSYDLTGICSKCMFQHYCGNVCPAMAYNAEGRFNAGYLDCEILQREGFFPNEFLVSS